MNGVVKIDIVTRRVSYSIELMHNVTVIQGDSGSGKSVLCDLISRKANRQGSRIDLEVTNNYACRHLTNEMCEAGMLKQLSNCIVFFDEDCEYMYSNDFAQQLLGSSNYFVLITRHLKRLSKLSVHINALCKLQYIDGTNYLTRQYPLAEDKTLMCGNRFFPNKIVTEDSDSGYRFFKLLAGDNCKAAKGRTKFVSRANELFETQHNYLIVADGGAFGGDINQVVYTLQQLKLKSFAFFLPDSFEEFLLHSNIFKGDTHIAYCLQAPWNLIDYSRCISFEQFFTDLLIEATTAHNFAYSKTGPLSPRFTNEANVDYLLSFIKHIEFEYLKQTFSETHFFTD